MAGHVTAVGVFVTVGAARLPLPATAQTVREWAEQVKADILTGALVPCPHCGTYFGCDCADWLEWMAAAEDDRRAREAEEAEHVA